MQLNPKYRVLQVVMLLTVIFLFFYITTRIWYVLGGATGSVFMIAGVGFFLAVLWLQHRAPFWSWLVWLLWMVVAGLCCSIYAKQFMNRAAFSGVAPWMLAINPFLVGFVPGALLSIVLAMAIILHLVESEKQ